MTTSEQHTTYPLDAKPIDSDATLSDWLGTCQANAMNVAALLVPVRDGSSPDPVTATMTAEEQLELALEEVRTIRKTAAHINAYGVPEAAQ